MKSNTLNIGVRSLVLMLAVVILAVVAGVAQAPPPPPPHDVMFVGGPGPMGGEFGEGRTVKGIPLSAQVVVTRDMTMADGNRIHSESQSNVYRDAEGRVRRDLSVNLATPATSPVKHNLVVITDPVAGTRYVLNPDNKTARQGPLRGPKHAGEDHQAHMNAIGGPGDVAKEQLGTKTVNGLQAEGVRVTRTIAAGAMGNEKAITVVTERWYSPDLQIVVMTTHTDPMMGTVTTKLVNVSQGAPDATLFQVPSDYSVKAGKPGDPMYVPMNP